jgi:hypothetical protein
MVLKNHSDHCMRRLCVYALILIVRGQHCFSGGHIVVKQNPESILLFEYGSEKENGREPIITPEYQKHIIIIHSCVT